LRIDFGFLERRWGEFKEGFKFRTLLFFDRWQLEHSQNQGCLAINTRYLFIQNRNFKKEAEEILFQR